MRVVSKGLHLRYPDTRIELWGKDLHAPMAERVLELPFDVYEGIRSPPPLRHPSLNLMLLSLFNSDHASYLTTASCWRHIA